MRPPFDQESDAILGLSPRGEIAIPINRFRNYAGRIVNPARLAFATITSVLRPVRVDPLPRVLDGFADERRDRRPDSLNAWQLIHLRPPCGDLRLIGKKSLTLHGEAQSSDARQHEKVRQGRLAADEKFLPLLQFPLHHLKA